MNTSAIALSRAFVIKLFQCAFENRSASAGIEEKTRDALDTVSDNKLRSVEVGDLDAVGGDCVDKLAHGHVTAEKVKKG